MRKKTPLCSFLWDGREPITYNDGQVSYRYSSFALDVSLTQAIPGLGSPIGAIHDLRAVQFCIEL